MSNQSGNRLVDGKVAFVTGAANGLGHAIVSELAAAGAVGTMFDILPRSEAGNIPKGWNYHQGTVTDENDVGAAIAGLHESHGLLDIAVANAGVVPPWRATRELDLDEWRRTFAVNVEGAAITIKLAAQEMIPSGGSIIALGSLNSWQGHPQQAAYVASKHAVLGLVRSAALDLGQHNIRVNALGPGPIATDALVGRVKDRHAQGGATVDEALQAMAGATALGRTATEADVARACLFLASVLASGITGQLVPVDAGKM
ncbi:MAG: SDR family oxidoreductase [Rhizobiales bacterium]|nr:SDR family oxidoreductase [Hyphomicrobiales bacterium]